MYGMYLTPYTRYLVVGVAIRHHSSYYIYLQQQPPRRNCFAYVKLYHLCEGVLAMNLWPSRCCWARVWTMTYAWRGATSWTLACAFKLESVCPVCWWSICFSQWFMLAASRACRGCLARLSWLSGEVTSRLLGGISKDDLKWPKSGKVWQKPGESQPELPASNAVVEVWLKTVMLWFRPMKENYYVISYDASLCILSLRFRPKMTGFIRFLIALFLGRSREL